MAIERISRIVGTGLPIRGDNIDTDRIIPARFLRSISFEGLEAHLFADDRAQADAARPGSHPLSDPRFAGASILVVNANFGCGSSREHAPQAIRRRGFHAVIGESFSEIFFGNAVALGLPCVTAETSSVDRLQRSVVENAATEIVVDIAAQQITWHAAETQAPAESIRLQIPAAARDAFLNGTWDASALLLDAYQDVESVATRLPYLQWAPATLRSL